MRNPLFIAWTFDHYLDCQFIPHVSSPRQVLSAFVAILPLRRKGLRAEIAS